MLCIASGIFGIDRIVIKLLQPFEPKIIANDLTPDKSLNEKYNFEWVLTENFFKSSDIITLHIPGNENNYNYLSRDKIAAMKTGASIINTSRGTVLDEDALYEALAQGHLGVAALDVFKNEPYSRNLSKLENVIFTTHMGASANECRSYV